MAAYGHSDILSVAQTQYPHAITIYLSSSTLWITRPAFHWLCMGHRRTIKNHRRYPRPHRFHFLTTSSVRASGSLDTLDHNNPPHLLSPPRLLILFQEGRSYLLSPTQLFSGSISYPPFHQPYYAADKQHHHAPKLCSCELNNVWKSALAPKKAVCNTSQDSFEASTYLLTNMAAKPDANATLEEEWHTMDEKQFSTAAGDPPEQTLITVLKDSFG